MNNTTDIELIKLLRKRSPRRYDSGEVTTWNRYREAKNRKLPSAIEILNILKRVRQPRSRALFAIQYLFGLRISECVRYRYRGKYVDDVSYELPSMKVKDFWVDVEPDDDDGTEGVKWFCAKVRRQKAVRIRNEVIKQLKTTDLPKFMALKRKSLEPRWDTVRVLVKGYDAQFVAIFDEYLDKVTDNRPMETWDIGILNKEIFPIGLIQAEKMCDRIFDFPTHFIRNIRAHHLVMNNHFSTQDLVKFFGWASHTQALRYSLSDDWAIKQRFKESM